MPIPFIGRLYLYVVFYAVIHAANKTKKIASPEYLALVGSFILIGLEIIVRGITLCLRMISVIFPFRSRDSLTEHSWAYNSLFL